jgi:16S rRNA (guanine527-N7)-methyltransferase
MSPVSADLGPPLPPERYREVLERQARDFSRVLEPSVASPLAAYLAELDRWRRKINLTGPLTADDLATHVLESALGDVLITHGARVIDIGSGAGLPGLPLAMCRPDISVTLLEPRGRRAAFLRHVVRSLALTNVAVQEARIEEVGGQTFDFATTRAVGGFSAWIGEAAFLEPRGLLLAWTTEPELVAAELPGFDLESSVEVPGTARRVIAPFRKRG